MPVSATSSFDNTGAQYNLSAIVTNGNFDQAKYEQYSPLFLPITYAFTYGTIFMTYPSLLVHTFLWYRHDIVRQCRRSMTDENDVHSYLMRKYPNVPRRWFIIIGISCFILGIIGVETLHTELPVWGFCFAVFLALVLVLPLGLLQAITNQQIVTVVLNEFIIGYILPGRPIATMVFKSVGWTTISQAISFSSDLKFGHYMKIPPRLMFSSQVLASIVAVISSIVAQEWALDNIPDICTPHQKSRFTCPNLDTFNTSSLFWGGIGPRRFFSPGSM
jgi:OPT family oligopeptide transporter